MNIIDKIWEKHVVSQQPDHPAVFEIDLTMLHEVTSAQAFAMLKERQMPVKYPERCIATIDHSIPTRKDRFNIIDPLAKQQVNQLRDNAKAFGIRFYDFDSGYQGIVHVIGPELGATQPGMTIVCGDSHTATHGAFGALAFGIGTSVLGHVLATGCLLLKKPKTMRVTFKGKFQKGVFAKDAIMKLIAEIGIGGATGHVIEYTGDAVKAMTMEERMTLCNMSIECGAVAGLVAPDQVTIDYIKGRKLAPQGDEFEKAAKQWLTIRSDEHSTFDREVCIDLDELTAMVTWGTHPGQAMMIGEKIPQNADEKSLEYTGLQKGQGITGIAIQWAFIGSCTNGRIEDLRIAAQILQHHKVKQGVTFYIVPGSEKVLAQAKEEGLDKIFENAGADFRMPGCSMCLAMNDDKVPKGQRCISSTNRNFVGRQGVGSITHLASPATVAASAVAGKIVSPSDYFVESN